MASPVPPSMMLGTLLGIMAWSLLLAFGVLLVGWLVTRSGK